MALLRIRNATALEGFRLRLELTDGTVVERDVSRLLEGPILGKLRDEPTLFAAVRVEAGSVAWPNGVDLCPDVLVWGGMPPEQGAVAAPLLVLGQDCAA